MADEAHGLSAESSKGIFEKAIHTPYKFGLTGTVKNTETHKTVIEGLTGKAFIVTTTKELMDIGRVAQLIIKCLVLRYPDAIRKQNHNKKMKYHDEMKFIVNYAPRNKLIASIIEALPSDQNAIVITRFNDAKDIDHINILQKAMENTKRHLFIITGDTPVEEREACRQFCEANVGVTLLVTYGVFSTGVNIKNVQWLLFATGYKSEITVPQTLGRLLRLDGKTNKASAIDIVDDFSYKKDFNCILEQFFERVKIYVQHGFKYILQNINIE
jgi:superfamily II DNA or RNA helicase